MSPAVYRCERRQLQWVLLQWVLLQWMLLQWVLMVNGELICV